MSRAPKKSTNGTAEQSARKNAAKTRGRPFGLGNPGRPKGCRNRSTLAAEALLEGEAEALARKAVDLAFEGDIQALRLCLDRLIPIRRERTILFDLPLIVTAGDACNAMASVLAGVASGQLWPSEAISLTQMIEAAARHIFAHDFEQRLETLEREQLR